MESVFVGLGRYGREHGGRLLRSKHSVVAFNRSPEKPARSLNLWRRRRLLPHELVSKLSAPRVVWVMVPPATPPETTIHPRCASLPATSWWSGSRLHTDFLSAAGKLSPERASGLWTPAPRRRLGLSKGCK